MDTGNAGSAGRDTRALYGGRRESSGQGTLRGKTGLCEEQGWRAYLSHAYL